jgi:NAD-dependent dihydropyrimidine dehydrogenase PreA subunit
MRLKIAWLLCFGKEGLQMPWVDENLCIGCGVCVEECPVGAIVLKDDVAEINMSDCIHCGLCHDVCDQEAVRHDSEKIPEEIDRNVGMTKSFMEACEKHLGGPEEQQKCLNRMIKHFNKEKVVAEKTIEKLISMRE